MTSRKPPSQRDAVYTERHQRRWLQSMSPGAAGGRFASAQPILSASLLAADMDGESQGDADTIVLFHQDALVASASGDQLLYLEFEPVENSEHLYWNGLYQPGEHWTRDGQFVTILDPAAVIAAGDDLVMEYAYYTGGVQVPMTLVGGHADETLPEGTQAGDLIVFAGAATGGITVTDPRLSLVWTNGNAGIWVGNQTASGAATLDVTAPSGDWCNAVFRNAAMITHAVNVGTGTTGTAPSVPGIQSIGIQFLDYNSWGAITEIDGYTEIPNAYADAVLTNYITRISWWQDEEAEESPAGAFTMTGTVDGWAAVTLRMVGTE